jgi:rhodanese-related sulfurtransferase
VRKLTVNVLVLRQRFVARSFANAFIFLLLFGKFICYAGEYSAGWGCSGKDSYCGIYCIYAASKILGKNIDSHSLIDPNYVSSAAGSSLAELKKAAKDQGLYAIVVKNLTTRELRNCRYPIILHVKSDLGSNQYNHYILFLGYSECLATVWDLHRPPEQVTLINIAISWDGQGLIISDAPIDIGGLFSSARFRFVIYSAVITIVILLIRRCKPLSQPFRLCRKHPFLLTSVYQASALTISALIVALAFNCFSKQGFGRNHQAVKAVLSAHIGSFLPKVGMQDLLKAMKRSELLIDARTKQDYEKGHIDGAINIPVNSSPEEIKRVMSPFPATKRIIVYCQSSRCGFAKNIVQKLFRQGFQNVLLFQGGWEQWQQELKKR